MSTSWYRVTVQPEIPAALIKEEEMKILNIFFDHEQHDRDGVNKIYFYSSEYYGIAVDDEEKQITQRHLIRIFQDIIKRANGGLDYVYLHAASTCNKMVPDAFSGWVHIIRKHSEEHFSTWDIVDELTGGSI